MIAAGEGRLSKDQAKRWARKQNFDTLQQWLWSYQRLPNLVWQLRAAGHVCVLLTQPLSYDIEGLSSVDAALLPFGPLIIRGLAIPYVTTGYTVYVHFNLGNRTVYLSH